MPASAAHVEEKLVVSRRFFKEVRLENDFAIEVRDPFGEQCKVHRFALAGKRRVEIRVLGNLSNDRIPVRACPDEFMIAFKKHGYP